MAKEEIAEQAVEHVAEAAEFVSEEAEMVAESVRRITGRDVSFTFLGAMLGLAGGAFVGYRLATKRLGTKYQEIADDEISEMRNHYQKKAAAAGAKPDLKETVENLGYASTAVPEVKSPASGAVVVPEMPEEIELVPATPEGIAEAARNVFEEQRGLSTDVWDIQKEMQSRTAEEPYIIHKDEYKQGNFQGEEHEQTTLTYFAEDDILIDESDAQIADIDETVGLENLDKFGHGSEDANVVYVRNHPLKTDFEVLRSGGSYAAEVHGVVEDDAEMEHSAMRRHRPRRSHGDD